MSKDEIKIGMSVYDLDNLDRGEGVIQGIILPRGMHGIAQATITFTKYHNKGMKMVTLKYLWDTHPNPGYKAIVLSTQSNIDALIDKETFERYKRGEIEYVKI